MGRWATARRVVCTSSWITHPEPVFGACHAKAGCHRGSRHRETLDAVEPPGRGNGYEAMAVGGCLVAALLAVSRLFAQVGLNHEDTWEFLDHMWDWLTVEADTCPEWETWWNPVLAMALGDPVPTQLLAGNPIPPDDLRLVCEDVAELVYGNLYTIVQHNAMFQRMERLRGQLARFGLDLPPPELIRRSPVADPAAGLGWGSTLSADEVGDLRAMDW